MPRGGARDGAGRKAGVPNKASQKRQAEAARTGELPLAYMLRVMRDESAPQKRRDEMAKAAALYVHPRLSSVETKNVTPPDLRSRLTPDSVNCLPAEIKREVLDLLEERRNLALRRSLIEWCRCAGYEPATHHLLLIKKLEGVARGQIQRLAVFMPPGSAKSTYGSILFAPWLLANSPMSAIIAASHTTELAEKWGRRVRNLIAEHGSALGISLAPDSQAAGRWALTSGGEYYAAGVGVGIAGFRADLAIIDDPIRSREDADSEATRERVWEWYKSDLSTRLKPGGRILLIQTRWHESDLAGRLLAEMDRGGDCWDIVSLPAQAEGGDLLGRKIGEWLWDDEYGYADFLRGQKKNQTTRNWSALFQQSPVPDTGDYFKADWIRTVDKLPDRNTLSIYGASDYAVTADGGDYTVHVVVGIDPEDRIYVLDLWRKQASSDDWIEAFCDLVLKWRPIGWAEETGQIRVGVGPFLERRIRERKAYIARQQFPTRGDKAVRAQSIRGRVAMVGLYARADAGWLPDLRSELLRFPAGTHDDVVDALGLVGQLLDYALTGAKQPKPKEHRRDGYSDALEFMDRREVSILTDSFLTL
jgi:predicted phage terminase large subunit-like protein